MRAELFVGERGDHERIRMRIVVSEVESHAVGARLFFFLRGSISLSLFLSPALVLSSSLSLCSLTLSLRFRRVELVAARRPTFVGAPWQSQYRKEPQFQRKCLWSVFFSRFMACSQPAHFLARYYLFIFSLQLLALSSFKSKSICTRPRASSRLHTTAAPAPRPAPL